MFCLVVLAYLFLADVNGQIHYGGHHHARPYQVGYYVRDPHHHQHAEEIRDHAGAVAGRYGYLDARGIGRQVNNYAVDHAGLRARVHTNEPAIVHNTPALAAHTDHHHARPYQVGYYVRDPHHHQHAEQIRDHTGGVAGRYGYLDARGIGRQVNYVADHAGLRARVHTNEPAVVHNTPVVAARIVSDGLQSSGVATVPVYDYGVNGYGHGYDGYGLGYGYSGLGYGYGGALGYTGLLGSYGGVYA